MKRYRLYRRNVDEETREVWWTRVASYATQAEAVAAGCALRCGHAVRGPSERRPKAGWCSEREATRLLQDAFDEMCPEEQQAYLGL
jgi:hypothetical protein